MTTIGANVTTTSEADGASSADRAGGAGAADSATSATPMLKVVRGQPSAEELAALVAVIASQAAGAVREPAAPPKVSGWTDRSRSMRSPGRPFPGGWRASALPR